MWYEKVRKKKEQNKGIETREEKETERVKGKER